MHNKWYRRHGKDEYQQDMEEDGRAAVPDYDES